VGSISHRLLRQVGSGRLSALGDQQTARDCVRWAFGPVATSPIMSLIGRYCCKSRFALGVGNSAGCWCDFRVKMRGASSPHVKLTSDFANTGEAIRISDCFSFDSFAKNSSLRNFRLLQQYRHTSDISQSLSDVCFHA
jgi:hypothetical protein